VKQFTLFLSPHHIYSKRQKAEGRRQKAEGRRQKAEGRRQTGDESEDRGQKVSYWYVVVSAVKSVLTFMATAIKKLICTP
jgi:hypothetical protein